MNSSETFFAFGAVVLVVAMLAIAIDWFGKPIKRKFVPKIYRVPEERRRRGEPAARPTRWSEASFVLPVMPETAAAIRHRELEAQAAQRRRAEIDARAEQRRAIPAVTGTAPAPGGAGPPDAKSTGEASPPVGRSGRDRRRARAPQRGRGWRVGGYIYNLTAKGQEPTGATIRQRYWRNVAAVDSSGLFGSGNVTRMAEGKPPQRRNPRTGRIESMALPVRSFAEARGRTPRPRWPGNAIDPFAPRKQRRRQATPDPAVAKEASPSAVGGGEPAAAPERPVDG